MEALGADGGHQRTVECRCSPPYVDVLLYSLPPTTRWRDMEELCTLGDDDDDHVEELMEW